MTHGEYSLNNVLRTTLTTDYSNANVAFYT